MADASGERRDTPYFVNVPQPNKIVRISIGFQGFGNSIDVHSTIKSDHQFILDQFVVPSDINGSLPIEISQTSINQINAIPKENLSNFGV